MKEYASEKLRNIALVSHGGAGKTSLGEAMLFHTGAVNRMGKVDDGNSVSDFEEEEIRRKQSLSTGILPVEFAGHKINVLDTPGFMDFVGEAISALWVSDGAVLLVDSVAGVEVGTEVMWDHCEEFGIPRCVVISKMDRDNANFKRVLAGLKSLSAKVTFIPVQLPWGEKQALKGVIDLFKMVARPQEGKSEEAIPEDLADAAEEARTALIEAAAEGDDALLEKYLEGEELSADEIALGFRKAVWSTTFVPVFASAGPSGIGTIPLLEAIVQLFPSPVDGVRRSAESKGEPIEIEGTDSGALAAYVWKTTADPFVGRLTYLRVFSGVLSSDSRVWNQNRREQERLGTLQLLRGKEQLPIKNLHAGDIGVVAKLGVTQTGDTLSEKTSALTMGSPNYPNALYSVAVIPKTQADAAKISSVLTKLSEEDPTLSWHQEASTNQTILQGMGDQHIDVAIRKAETKFQVGLEMEVPLVPYRETITKVGSAQYRHKKQTGGSGQFAEVHMRIEPHESAEFEFVSEVIGGRISSGFMPAIEKGVKQVMMGGVLSGHPIEKVKVAITDGKEHPVDSKAIAFETAGREAFKIAVRNAGPVMLEPIMELRITVPEANMGDIMGDLNTRRARVQGADSDRGRSIITAHAPLAEVQRYTTDLRSMTGGRGFFTMKFSHYENVPPQVAQQIIAAAAHDEDEA
ncbi:MAG: elongation factor G [Chloroflexi bacterium]|nr:MAG: elongation factor G [Chloroflexota bacterium]